MTARRARAGHARTKRAGVASRALAALAVVATAASTLVVSQAAVPQAAQAAQEPAATGIEVGAVRASMGTGIINASETDTTTSYPNNYIRYGITKAMSETPYSNPAENSGKPITDNKPVRTQLGGTVANANDLWTYITRGWPWKWDENPTGTSDSEKWMDAQYKKWHDGGDAKLWANGQSAIGFKPNDPGTVQPGQTFLLGAIRHNNLPIRGGDDVKPYLHSSLNITLPDLLGGTPESFPFVNQETYNTLSSTIIYRKGGAYIKHPGIAETGTCRTDIGVNGVPATQRPLVQSGVDNMRDAVMDQGTYYGTPQWAMKNGKYVLDENGQRQFIGTAYEPDPVDANDRSKGYVNKPESQSGRYYWSVNDLNLDTAYWLVETKAPAGHSLLPQPIEFKLTSRPSGSGTTVELAADLTNQAKWATSAVQAFASDASGPGPKGFMVGQTRKATILVKDTEVGELPKAGSTGIYPYIGVAAALMSGAMVMTVVTTKRRKANA